MSLDQDLLQEFKQSLADRYTAAELVELLDLDVWHILEMFEEEITELKFR